MARDRVTDGRRIAELLSSELHGHERGALGRLSVVDADRDVEPTEFGAFAYGVMLDGEDGERVADVYVHPDRAHVEFRRGVDAAASAAAEAALRVRPKAVDPPRTLVFVESGAAVKRVLPAFRAAVEVGDNAGA